MTTTAYPDTPESEETSERPWIMLTTTYDVEAWIANYDRDLQKFVQKSNATGYGVCFRLIQGGEIFLHTCEGVILLDVTPEAEWVSPLIAAATRIAPPHSQIWTLPDDTLTQLVLGLSSLIASTRLIASHSFKVKKY
jgi:hypothetical protein